MKLSLYKFLSNRGSNPVSHPNPSKTQVDKFDKNPEIFKIQNSERYKNSDRNYKPFKSDCWKSHGGGAMEQGVS